MMNRRGFLQATGAAAPAPLVAASAGARADSDADAAVTDADEPRVFVREDFHHLSVLTPPLTRADVTKTVDLLEGTSVNTLIFSLGSRGGMCLYDTHVGQMHSENVDRWNHAVHYRDALHIRQLVAEGWDRPQLFCDRCHANGLLFLASAPLNIGAYTTEAVRGTGRTSDFVFDNPQLRVGPDDDPRAEHVSPTRMNFMYPAVREERLRIYEELLTRYETDGIEVQSEVLPICKYSEAARCAPLLTAWLRQLRTIAKTAEQSQGRRKRIYFRVPADPEVWKIVGFDVARWISEQLVDGLICASNESEVLDQDLDLSEVVALSDGSSCRVLVDCGTTLQKRIGNKATPEMIWAAAANALHQGAVGLGLNEMVRSQELSLLGDMYRTLRLLGSPDLLATADKTYHVRDLPRDPQSYVTGLPGTKPPLPRLLKEGLTQSIPLRIADNLKHWHEVGRVKAVRLRVRISNIEPSTNEVSFTLNGQALEETDLEITDLTYRFINEGVAYQGSQIYEFILNPDNLPVPGTNHVGITLTGRDPAVDLEFHIADVDCTIEYRQHRNFRRNPIEY